MTQNQYIKRLSELSASDIEEAGGKGASLGKLLHSGFNVPNGYVLLSAAFNDFLKINNLKPEITKLLKVIDLKDLIFLKVTSKKIQKLILKTPISDEIKTQVFQYFNELNSELVSVRSSATFEDGKINSWAGQFDTYLNTNEESLIQNITKCWASLFSQRSIIYFLKKNSNIHEISLAVIVQKMVQAEISGVAFSCSPVSNDDNLIMIETVQGLGTSLVSGTMTPINFLVNKNTLKIINLKTTDKFYSNNKQSNSIQKNEVLTIDQIKILSKTIISIENTYGYPVDVEFCFYKQQLYILQTRPITKNQFKDNIVKPSKIYSVNANWQYYLSRPFLSLFGASVWNQWYSSEITKILFNTDMQNSLSVQMQNGLIKNYRLGSELKTFRDRLKIIGKEDFELSESLLIKGVEYNQMAIRLLKENDLSGLDLIDQIDFMTRMALCATIFPTWAFEDSAERKYNKNKSLLLLGYSKELRRVSYYPEFFLKIILPLARLRIKKSGFSDPDKILQVVTAGELINQNFFSVTERISNVEKNKYFVYEVLNNNHNLYWLTNPKNAISKLFSQYNLKTKSIGTIAFKGDIKSMARLVLSNDTNIEFNEGDILVSVSTNPNLAPLMQKAGAVLTDEGGALCHAAILCREYGIPCIVGLGNITDVVSTGDYLHVDANNGVVKIIKKNLKLK